jgi:hypothetical protein
MAQGHASGAAARRGAGIEARSCGTHPTGTSPALRHKLRHAEDLVEATLRLAVDKALRPWRRTKEGARAADEDHKPTASVRKGDMGSGQ